MYISARQYHDEDEDDAVQDILEVDLGMIHAAINSINSDTEATMISWNQVHRATQEDGVLLRLMDNIPRGMPDSGLELEKDLRECGEWCAVFQRQDCDTGSIARTSPDRYPRCPSRSLRDGWEDR